MPLTANRNVDHYVDQELRTLQVAAAKHIFRGAFVGLNSAGYAEPLVAGEPFVGIAYEQIDNTAGANGAMSVRVYTEGDFGQSLTGATVANIGRPVFASADNVLTFTASANSYVGLVQDVPAANEIILRIGPNRGPVKTILHAVENLGAGADIAVRAVHAFNSDAWILAARVVNQSIAAAGINDANTCVVQLATGAGAVATTTFNTTVLFPSVNASFDMGALTNVHALPGHVLTLAVTNGATADPSTFLVEVDYV